MRALLRAAFTVGGLTALVKLTALAKDTLVASALGSGAVLDAFLLALVVPAFFISVATGSLPAALTPAFVAERERRGALAARQLASVVLRRTYGWLGLLSIAAGVLSLGLLAAPGTRLDPDTRMLLPVFSAALAPYTLLQGTSAAWSGLLAAEGDYMTGALAPITQPLGTVIALLLWPERAAWALVGGLLAGTVVQCAWLATAMRRRGLPFGNTAARSASPDLADAEAMVRRQYVPAVAAAIVMSATGLVDQTMAAWLPSGSVSALGYGTKLSALAMSVGAMALSTSLLPHLSTLVARREWQALRLLERRLRWLILGITVPVTIVLAVYSVPLVRLVFERGAFTAVETATVAQVQAAYLLQVPGHLLGILYVRLISALQANRLITTGAAINFVVNLALNLLFMRWLGVVGIALSTAGVYVVSCAYLAVAARRALARAEHDAPTRTVVAASITEVPCASAA